MNELENNYFENDFCHGCLSFGRRCTMYSENAGLFYQLLDPINIVKEPISLVLCWECEATLKKIRLFQFKVNKAQAYLQNVISHKIELKSLSTLTATTKKNYDQTVNIEIPDSFLSSSPNEDEPCNFILNTLESSDSTILKVPIESNNYDDDAQEDNKINNHNYEIDKQNLNSEIDIDTDFADEKLPTSEIKEELDADYLDCNVFNNDNVRDISVDEIIKDIKSENLTKIKKYVRSKYKKKQRAKKIPIDLDNVEKYFKKLVLPPDEFKAELMKIAKEKCFKASKFKCTACAMVFLSHPEEQSHKELHNNTTKYRCDLCNLSYKLEVDLVSHGAAHEFEQCLICSFVCRTPDARKRHLKMSHRQGYWQCCQCSATFRLDTEYTAHRENLHKTFICDYCNAKRFTKANIQSHIIKRHMLLKMFQCYLCMRKFRRNHNLKEHLIDIHGVPGLSTASKESTYCVECNKQFTSKHTFSKHLRSSAAHTSKAKMAVPCPDCPKIFTRRLYLKNHYAQFHGGGTKFRCDPCNKSFASGYILRVHIDRVHNKIPVLRNKVCETCGIGFQDKHTLVKHMRTHTGERPYECSHCPARFAQKYTCKVHILKQHLPQLQRIQRVRQF